MGPEIKRTIRNSLLISTYSHALKSTISCIKILLSCLRTIIARSIGTFLLLFRGNYAMARGLLLRIWIKSFKPFPHCLKIMIPHIKFFLSILIRVSVLYNFIFLSCPNVDSKLLYPYLR